MSFADHFDHIIDSASIGLPVYSIVKDLAETVSRECGMSERGAKVTGMIVGATASATTSMVVGTP
ncbi:MAG TPA: hypothetical protein VHZ97_18850 [Pseudonocardiaceae bacterium]|jgi:hypothetical protein|nr:hypothetical protein [Pseudonocardiaceae bacterium]